MHREPADVRPPRLPVEGYVWRLGAGLLVAAVALGGASPAAAREDGDAPAPWVDLGGPPDPSDRAIQRRKYQLAHELGILVGGMPADPYYKGYSITAGYTLHFNDYVGWEILSFTYAYDMDTNLKTEVLRILISQDPAPGSAGSAAGPTLPDLPEVTWFAASHLVIKPFYGKQAFLDDALLHVEGYLDLGPTLLSVQKESGARAFGFGADFGLGVRLWLNEFVSLRLEASEAVFLLGSSILQMLHLQGGLALNFGSDG